MIDISIKCLLSFLLFQTIFTIGGTNDFDISHDMKVVKANGMTFSWKILDERLLCKVTAPMDGWVAIGFNPKQGLPETNLIMGAVRDGKPDVDDRYILSPGDHRSMETLGSTTQILEFSGVEVNGSTTITFIIALKSQDQFHHTLIEGKWYHLLMAYSESDDFDHHSRMRTAIKIKL